MRLCLLLGSEADCVECDTLVARQFGVVQDVLDQFGDDQDTLFLPGVIESLDTVRELVAFASANLSAKVQHIPAPLSREALASLARIGVPDWAARWVEALSPTKLAELAVAADALNFAPMAMLCTAELARRLASLSLTEKEQIASLNEVSREKAVQTHHSWASKNEDVDWKI
jgi:hypothetical protein